MPRRTSLAHLAAAAVAILAAAPRAQADWRVCDEGKFSVTGGSVTPYPVRAGQEMEFQVNLTSASAITDGTLEVHVDYLGFHVYSTTGPLCEAVACPLPPGTQTLAFRQKLPKTAPPGPYLGVFQARDAAGTVLFCVNINFRVALFGGSGAVSS